MKKQGWMLQFLVFLALQMNKATSQSAWLNVDCGMETPRTGTNFLFWSTDKDFTKSGINMRVPGNPSLEEMSTLRFFPNNQAEKSCYTLPAYKQTLRYIIRAGFYYNNYDNSSRPPSFDLHLDGQRLSTVNISSNSGPIYHEAIYVTNGSRSGSGSGSGSINVCLVRTREGDVPFISSLETVPLWNNLYPQMGLAATFNLVARINFGGDEIRYTGILFPEEKYNRIWTRGVTPPNSVLVTTVPDSSGSEIENDPPISLMRTSIMANTSDPIFLSVHLRERAQQSGYFVFYFTETGFRPNSIVTRIVDIHINGVMKYTVGIELNRCKVVTVYPVSIAGPMVNITLAQSKLSTLPPIISAMEVFSKVNTNQGNGFLNGTNGVHFFLKYLVLLIFYVWMIFF